MPDRRKATIATAVLYTVGFVFLLLVALGNVHADTPSARTLGNVYFFRLDLSSIIPTSVSNAVLLNSVARSMGLHDFYQVGLWNFCEGYNTEGITYCSPPTQGYWFNPVEILLSELLAGSTIVIPTQVTQILNLLKLAQKTMFALFVTALVLSFVVLVVATPLVPRSRLWSVPASIAALVAAVCATGAAVLATIMSVGAKIALTSVDELNIRADVGVAMFVLMWLGTVAVDTAAIFHVAMACFCAPHREKLGRGSWSTSASATDTVAEIEGSGRARSLDSGAASLEKMRYGSSRPRLPDFLTTKRRRKNGAQTEGVENVITSR